MSKSTPRRIVVNHRVYGGLLNGQSLINKQGFFTGRVSKDSENGNLYQIKFGNENRWLYKHEFEYLDDLLKCWTEL